MPCPNCGGERIAHLNYGGGKGEWKCLNGCPWRTGTSHQLCSVCGQPSIYLCDGPGQNGSPCDAPLCWRCTDHVKDEDIDYCPAHARETDVSTKKGDRK